MLATLFVATTLAQFHERSWQPVRTGMLYGISGMALVESQLDAHTFLIVHDNKREGEGRVATLTVGRGASPQYKAINWEGETPIDLEGLTTIPGQANRFVAIGSAGKAFVLELSGDRAKVTVRSSFMVPAIAQGANFEGIAMQKVGDHYLLAWGHRGETPAMARIFLARTTAEVAAPMTAASADLPIPWPAAEKSRGLSDIKIDPTGTIFITSAFDAGDDGPFQSALFTAGVAAVSGDSVTLRVGASARLFWTDQHKIEAFDLLPGKFGGVIFGTDDENFGAAVWNNFWPE